MLGFRKLRNLRREEDGSTLLEFGLILPILMTLSFAILDSTLMFFDMHRANEATRRVARIAAMIDPLVDEGTLTGAGTATCLGGSTCGAITDMLAAAQAILPSIQAENIQITYSTSALGDAATPGGIKPIVTVSLVDIQHEFMLLKAIPALPDSIALPSFATTVMGKWYTS